LQAIGKTDLPENSKNAQKPTGSVKREKTILETINIHNINTLFYAKRKHKHIIRIEPAPTARATKQRNRH
jgi:DNA helicase TIP49 (TBP-interacting protein)